MSSLMNIKNMYNRNLDKVEDRLIKVTNEESSVKLSDIKLALQNNNLNENELKLVKQDLITLYLSVTGGIAKLDPDVTEAQSVVVFENTPDFEKTLSADVAVYMAYNYGVFSYALLINYMNIRDFMGAVLEQEIALDECDAVTRASRRKAMQLNSGESIPRDSGVIDLIHMNLNHNDVVILASLIKDSYLRYEDTKLDSYFEKAVMSLQDEDAVVIGYILSNYFYILRAINYNPKCFVTLIDIISRCEKAFTK